jgi:hypothetical protein
MNDDDYKGIKVGVEIKLGERLPSSQLAIVVILLEEIRNKYPREYAAAVKAIQEVTP